METALLVAAAFVAGALNAVAGGGSFLTLPALVFTGVPPVVANATGTVALLPGYMAGAWGFREDMQPPPGLSMRAVVVLALIGGSAGAALLLVTPDATFMKIIPWLLLAATALFAFGPQLRQWLGAGAHPASAAKAGLGTLAVAAYGGYFGLAANLAPEARASYDRLGEVDSIVIDPHKHGLQPYGCGCVLFRDPAVGRHYQHDSPYTYFTSPELHLGEISLECSRAGAAAAALWLTTQVLPLTPQGLGAALRPVRAAALRWHRALCL